VRIGHGVAPIPVPNGSPLGGYTDRRGGSSGVADQLEAHVMTVSDGATRLALVVLDVVCVNTDLAGTVRHALAEHEIDEAWVSATHTHSGPDTGCAPRGATTPEPWLTVVTEAVRQAARLAVATEMSGSLVTTTVNVAGVGSVRSRPGAACHLPADVVTFRTRSGHIGGALVVLPVHPTVLPAASTVVSADLTGAVRRAVAATRKVPWVVVATGAAGDISTRGVRRGASPGECARLGKIVADQVLTVVRTGPSRVDDSDRIATAATDVVMAAGTPPTGRSTVDARSRQAETLRQALRLRRETTEPVPATVRAARVGDLRLIGVPGEPFLDLRSRAAGAVLLGYVGGYVGYLPTAAAFAGEPTYETVISPVAPGEPERLVDAGVALLARLDRRAAR
jgi:hypothetical protein